MKTCMPTQLLFLLQHVTQRVPFIIVCMSPYKWLQHILSQSDTWLSIPWCKETKDAAEARLLVSTCASIQKCTSCLPLHMQLVTKCSYLMMYFHFFTRVFMLPAFDPTYSNWSSGTQKRDKPNICDHPNITLCSKNTCRSGSGDYLGAPTCGPGLSGSAVTPVPSACFSLSRPSVTAHTHTRTVQDLSYLFTTTMTPSSWRWLKLFHVLLVLFAFL